LTPHRGNMDNSSLSPSSGAKVYHNSRGKFISLINMTVSYFQVSVILMSIDVDYPLFWIKFMPWINIIISFNFVDLAGPECSLGALSFFHRWIMKVAAPFLLMIPFLYYSLRGRGLLKLNDQIDSILAKFLANVHGVAAYEVKTVIFACYYFFIVVVVITGISLMIVHISYYFYYLLYLFFLYAGYRFVYAWSYKFYMLVRGDSGTIQKKTTMRQHQLQNLRRKELSLLLR
jgi:hypothetical protein